MNPGPGPSKPAPMSSAALDIAPVHALVAQAQRGDRPAADRLVREHQGWVRSVIYGVTGRPDLVDDIAQQVWAQVWERLGTLQDPSRIRSWLYAVARNAAIDQCQAHKRRVGIELEKISDGLGDRPEANPARAAADQELKVAIAQAVQSLPVIYREPFVLRHLEDWSYAEIGELLGLPVETVETRLVRARRLLREMLKAKVES